MRSDRPPETTQDARPAPPVEIPTLNGLRGLAVLLVLASHAANNHMLPGVFGKALGQVGVILFFILSGFLMAYLYIRRPWTRATVGSFLVARAGRVLPLYFAIVTGSFLISTFVYPEFCYGITEYRDLFLHLFLIKSRWEMWTITVEIHFYAIYVFMWGAYANRPSASRLLLALFTGLAVSVGLVVLDNNLYDLRWGILPYHFHVFALGVGVGWMFAMQPGGFLHGRWLGSRWLGGLALLLFCLNLPELRRATGTFVHPWLDPVTIGLSLAIFLFALRGEGVYRLFALPAVQYVGTISYAVYLFHRPVIETSRMVYRPTGTLDGLAVLAVVTAVTFAAAHLSLRFFEEPLRVAARRAWQRYATVPAHPRE